MKRPEGLIRRRMKQQLGRRRLWDRPGLALAAVQGPRWKKLGESGKT